MDNLLKLIEHYRYIVLVPLAIVEGPLISFVGGLLVRLGFMSFLPVYILILIGDVISDAFYYNVGRIGDEVKLVSKYGSKYKIIDDNFGLLNRLWANHGAKTMFLAKFAYGLTIPFLISAGLSKMSYKRYFSYTMPPTILKYFLLMGLGYYLAYSFKSNFHYFYYSGVVMAAIVAFCILVYKFGIRYLRRRVESIEGH